HHRRDLLSLGLVDGVAENLADLRLSAEAAHGRHALAERRRLGAPGTRLAFAEAAIEHELHVEPAERLRRLEPLGLQVTGAGPRRFAAGGGIHGEAQAAAAPGRPR